MCKHILALLLCIINFQSSLSIIIRDDFSDEKSKQYAKNNFSCVGELIVKLKDGHGGKYGSCVLVSPNAVLTAKHVINNGEYLEKIMVNFAPTGTDFSDETIPVRHICHSLRHPTADLAVLKFHEPIADIAPIKLYNAEVKSNTQAYAVGYGAGGSNTKGANASPDHIRRMGTTRVDRNNDKYLVNQYTPIVPPAINSTPSTFHIKNKDPMDCLISDNDSGGPLLIGKIPSDLSLIGVAEEHAYMPQLGYGVQRWVPVQPHIQWIIDNINKALPQ